MHATSPGNKRLLQCWAVTDWRQVQARIRKARTSADPPGQLAALYERTRDAMVAFELAQFHEKAGAHAEAARWYTSAAERFRRAQWKQKAEEALARLGAPIPGPRAQDTAEGATQSSEPTNGAQTGVAESSAMETSAKESESAGEQTQIESGAEAATESAQPAGGAAPPGAPGAVKRKRRGRRGGRGRRKGKRPEAGAAPAPAAQQAAALTPRRVAEGRPEPRSHFSDDYAAPPASAPEPTAGPESAAAAPALSREMARGRAGDPALVSRMALLESQLRRLLACSLHPVDSPEDAPAGPGVFLLTDSDQTSYYYIEACQTLRIGIGNLLRSGRSSREGANLKERLADHLGINESRVSKYLKDHCAVRWLQLDEGAPLLAHFAVAVLRPIVNE